MPGDTLTPTLRHTQMVPGEEGSKNGRSYAVAADRLRRFGRNRSSMRREASRSNSFSPQSEQTSSWRFGTSAVLRRTVALTVTVFRRIRRLPHVGHRRIAISYPFREKKVKRAKEKVFKGETFEAMTRGDGRRQDIGKVGRQDGNFCSSLPELSG